MSAPSSIENGSPRTRHVYMASISIYVRRLIRTNCNYTKHIQYIYLISQTFALHERYFTEQNRRTD